MPGGRPTDYLPEYCEQVIELGRQGKSKAQIAATLDVARMTLDNWAAVHPEFLDAITRARDLSMAWWEDKGQGGLDTSGFNASLWSRSMAARFPDDYTERQKRELTGKDGGPVQQIHRIERTIVDPANPDR
jgi:hypothetical protein